jgi:hypothetical protein
LEEPGHELLENVHRERRAINSLPSWSSRREGRRRPRMLERDGVAERRRGGWARHLVFLIRLTSRAHFHLSECHFVFATSSWQVGPTCQKSCQFMFRPSFARIAKNHPWSGRFTFKKRKVTPFHKFSLKSGSFMLFTPRLAFSVHLVNFGSGYNNAARESLQDEEKEEIYSLRFKI